MIPIDVLVRPVTSDDIKEKALDMLEAVKIPARSWRTGGVALTLLTILCLLAGMAASMVTSIVRGLFLAYARGDYLTAHAKDVYDVDRIPATFATGKVVLTNRGGGIYPYGANECIVRSSTTFKRYRITDAFTLGAGSEAAPTPTSPLNVIAVEAGSASSAGVAEIDELETTKPKVTVTNPAALVGLDAESDDQIVKRCLVKKGTWSPFGPRDAYESAVLDAKMPDGTPAGLTRVSVSRSSSQNTVTVVCATPTGTPTSDQLVAAKSSIEKVARAGATILVLKGAIQKPTVHAITLWAKGGADTVLKANAQKALDAFYSTYEIGGISKEDGAPGFLWIDRVKAAVIASGAEVFDADFDDDSDIELADDEVATNTATILVRIR